MRIIILFLYILFFLPHCATTKKPLWVKEFGKKTFSEDGIEGIGFASFNKKDKSTLRPAREIAYNDAIKNLAIKLKTELSGTIQHKMEDKITKVDKKYHQQAADQIESLTNVVFESVLGRKYFEEYIDYENSLYWVYVWTTKEELFRTISEELEKQEIKNSTMMKLCIRRYKDAEQLISSGQVLKAIMILNEILKNLQEIKGIYFVDNIDNISFYYIVDTKIKTISSIELYSISDTNLETLVNVPAQLELIVRCQFYNEDGQTMPIVSFPLKAKFVRGSGEIELAKPTDANGTAKFRIYKLTSRDNEIEIYPDTDLIKGPKVVFHIKAKGIYEIKKIMVEVQSKDILLSDFLKKELISKLRHNEFNIVESHTADYCLTIKFSLDYLTNRVNLLDAQRTMVESYTGSATLEVFEIQTKNIILSKSFTGITGFGKTQKEAEENTAKKLADVIGDYLIKNLK
ncbi:MAG: hypothetical protein NZ928_06590 [Endomicrobia bacterium]|nr:hypothetical protein [Endomicrobiia bacterium]MDW8055457.1 hypothetical protein [Elusimicrobiota bacterium]